MVIGWPNVSESPLARRTTLSVPTLHSVKGFGGFEKRMVSVMSRVDMKTLVGTKPTSAGSLVSCSHMSSTSSGSNFVASAARFGECITMLTVRALA
eukprot:3149515-Amphidinium_carterae.1